MGKSVSIIIPTHNRATLLPRAIRSAASQTYPADVIVVDDTSNKENENSTIHISAEYPGRIIRYVAVPPCSLGGARNAGVKATQTDYVTFLDDDDELLLPYLEEVMNAFSKLDERYGAVGAGSILIDPRGRSSYGVAIADAPDSFWSCRVGNAWTFRREVFEKGIWFDDAFPNQEDREFSMRFFSEYRAFSVDKPLIRYALRLVKLKSNAGTLSSNHAVEFDCSKRILEKYYAVYQRGGPGALAAAELSTGITAGEAGFMKDARKYLRDALRSKFSWQAFLYYASSLFGFYGFSLFHLVKNRGMRWWRILTTLN